MYERFFYVDIRSRMVAEYMNIKYTSNNNDLYVMLISKALRNVLHFIQQKQALTKVCACFFMDILRSRIVAERSTG